LNVPEAVGVPLMVMVPALHAAESPVGKPVALLMPVAPVVVMVMFGDKAVLIHNVRGGGLEAVLAATTMMEPVAFTAPHPPVNGME
jgi:hypothetical protein